MPQSESPTQVICEQVFAYLKDGNIPSDEMERLRDALSHLKDAARFRASALQVREQVVLGQTPISSKEAVTQAFADHDMFMQHCRDSSAQARNIFVSRIGMSTSNGEVE